MKKNWKWLYAVLAVLVIVGMLFALGMIDLPFADPEESVPAPTTVPTTAPTTAPAQEVVTPGILSFTGKVLELDGDSALMECYDKEKFDTVWVTVSQSGLTPQVGEAYVVEYEDLVMPSLPPRITAVKITKQSTSLSTGETLYNNVVDAVISAFPWENDAIPGYLGMSYMYFRHTALSEVGWDQLDLDGNGQKELLIGNATTATYPYDCFTVKDGELVHLFAGGERDSFTVLENGYIRRSWSGSAVCSGNDYYRLVDGELQFLERVTYDADYALESGVINSAEEADATNCYFHTTVENEGDEFKGYRSVTTDECEEIQKKYNEYKEIEISYNKLG